MKNTDHEPVKLSPMVVRAIIVPEPLPVLVERATAR